MWRNCNIFSQTPLTNSQHVTDICIRSIDEILYLIVNIFCPNYLKEHAHEKIGFDCYTASQIYFCLLDDRKCTDAEFRCRNGYCIQQSYLCDGQADCQDSSDETPNCGKCGNAKNHCMHGRIHERVFEEGKIIHLVHNDVCAGG